MRTIIVVKYYTEDLRGARLNGKSYKEVISPLVTWQNEPGWDFFYVSNKAYISKIEKDENKASIEVRYDNAGFLNGDQLIEEHFTEVIVFHVVRVGGRWQIEDPMFPPHVSPGAFALRFEQAVTKEKNPNTAERMRMLVNLLKEMDSRLVRIEK